jgi:uncharacterized membrane protein
LSDIYKTPQSDLQQPAGSEGMGGSVEHTLLGQFEFDPFTVIGEAFQLIDGIKGIILLGVLLVMLASGMAQQIAAPMVRIAAEGNSLELLAVWMVANVIQIAVPAPFVAGLFWVALRRAAGHGVELSDLFVPFRHFVPLAIAAILSSLLTMIGIVLLIIPGVYLAVAYALSVPVLIDKSTSPWQALETSRLVVTKCWWRMLLTLLLLGVILFVSVLFLLVPLIWTLPMAVMTLALVYRNLCGFTAAAA